MCAETTSTLGTTLLLLLLVPWQMLAVVGCDMANIFKWGERAPSTLSEQRRHLFHEGVSIVVMFFTSTVVMAVCRAKTLALHGACAVEGHNLLLQIIHSAS
jgi:hypothetical protein